MSTLSLSFEQSLAWTQRLAALSLLVQTLELLQLRRAYADDGVWRWPVLKPEQRALPWLVRVLLSPFLPYRGFLTLLCLRLALVVMLALGWQGAAPLLLLSQLAICVRFRGTYNGGSDYMSVVVLLGLTASYALEPWPAASKGALAYCAAQLVLSYFIAGLVKLQNADWRAGRALSSFVGSGRYGTPVWATRLLERRGSSRLASWSVMAFECGFPLAVLAPQLAPALLALGASFHLANAVVFGLNRFFFAWLAAYPSLLYFALGSATL